MNGKSNELISLENAIQSGNNVSIEVLAQSVKAKQLSNEKLALVTEQYTIESIVRAKQLLTSNEAIEVNTEIERNHKTVNSILLENVVSLSQPTEAQEAILIKIANQCPQVGGDAVYEARAALGYLIEQSEYDDETACNTVFGNKLSEGRSEKKEIASLLLATLYPNPTADWAYITGIKKDDAVVYLYDSFGKEIKSFPLLDSKVYVGDLPEGMYRIHIISAGSLIFSKNLIHLNP
jgi:hypothetical protein